MNIQKIELTDKSIVKIILWVLGFAAIFYFKVLILVLFLAIILAAVANRVAGILKKIKFPRGLSISLFYIFFVAFIVFAFYNFIPAIVNGIAVSVKELPGVIESLKNLNISNGAWYSGIVNSLDGFITSLNADSIIATSKDWLYRNSIANSSSIMNVVVNFVLTIVISLYIALSKDGVQSFLKLVSPKRYEKYVVNLFDRTQTKLSGWFFGQVLVAFISSILVYLLLLILNIPFAITIALLTFVFELLPIVGVVAASIPAVFLAYMTGGFSLVIITLISFFLISQISSYFLYPKIVGKFSGIPTVAILIAMFIGGQVGGFWGVLISIPVATIVMELLLDYNKSKGKENENVELIKNLK